MGILTLTVNIILTVIHAGAAIIVSISWMTVVRYSYTWDDPVLRLLGIVAVINIVAMVAVGRLWSKRPWGRVVYSVVLCAGVAALLVATEVVVPFIPAFVVLATIAWLPWLADRNAR